jgi:putative transposase
VPKLPEPPIFLQSSLINANGCFVSQTLLICYARHFISLKLGFHLQSMPSLSYPIICIVFGHCQRDADFSKRWRLIKSEFSRHCPEIYKKQRSASRLDKGEQAIWQRRFWEHQIRDERDFAHHVDYVHYNPVSHGLVMAPRDWVYSSFHRYVRDGLYSSDWGAEGKVEFEDGIGNE